MIDALRRQFHQVVTSGAQLALLVGGAISESARGWSIALGLVALVSVAAWLAAVKRRRTILDTPTARIASAPQGYVEIRGTGHALADNPVRSPLTGLPCLWYRYQVERKTSDGKWETAERGESDASFIVRDDSGEVLVDPDGAEIMTGHKETWQRHDTRNTEWKFINGDPMYVLGRFHTIGGTTLSLDFRGDVSALLAEWKRDPQALKARFDANGDGEIDLDEWQQARHAAGQEVAERHREARNLPAVNVVRAPRDRPYLIANLDPQRLARRFGLWALFHVLVFLGALAAIPYARLQFG